MPGQHSECVAVHWCAEVMLGVNRKTPVCRENTKMMREHYRTLVWRENTSVLSKHKKCPVTLSCTYFRCTTELLMAQYINSA
jgi:hypothetical protein